MGGSRPEGVEDLLYSGRPGGPTLWEGDMGPHSKDGEGPGQISVQGREEDHWEAPAAKERRDMGIPTSGRGTEGSGNGGDTDVHNTEAEYGCTIYCDATDYGPMRAGVSATRSAGVLAVAGEGRNRPGGGEKLAAESTTRSDTESEEKSDGDLNGVAGGGEEESQGAIRSSVAGRRMDE